MYHQNSHDWSRSVLHTLNLYVELHSLRKQQRRGMQISLAFHFCLFESKKFSLIEQHRALQFYSTILDSCFPSSECLYGWLWCSVCLSSPGSGKDCPALNALPNFHHTCEKINRFLHRLSPRGLVRLFGPSTVEHKCMNKLHNIEQNYFHTSFLGYIDIDLHGLW